MMIRKWPPAVAELLAASQDPKASRALLCDVVTWSEQEDIHFTPVQLQVLANHLIEMQARARTHTDLPAVDPALFQEVSAKSLALAQRVCARVGQLSASEPYVLSIHFEAAQNAL